MGYLFLESIVSQLHLYHLKSIILYLFKLLKRIHMVSLITVLNGNVWQFVLLTNILNFDSFDLFANRIE